MALVNSNIGTRATLALGASTYEDSEQFQITGLRFTGIERAAIDSSYMGLDVPGAAVIGNRTYIPGALISPGQLIVEGHFLSHKVPPFFSTPGTESTNTETITISFPNTGATSATTWVGTAFLVSMEANIPMEEMMSATLTWQFAGGITVTAGS